MSDRSHCRSCSAPILFVPVEPKGRMMPLDLDHDPAGNIVHQDGAYRVLKAGETVTTGVARWRSHFVTCPKAGTHRKKRGGD